MYTSNEVAEMLGVSVRRVQQIAGAMGIKKAGRDYLFTRGEVKKMILRKTKPGR